MVRQYIPKRLTFPPDIVVYHCWLSWRYSWKSCRINLVMTDLSPDIRTFCKPCDVTGMTPVMDLSFTIIISLKEIIYKITMQQRWWSKCEICGCNYSLFFYKANSLRNKIKWQIKSINNNVSLDYFGISCQWFIIMRSPVQSRLPLHWKSVSYNEK